MCLEVAKNNKIGKTTSLCKLMLKYVCVVQLKCINVIEMSYSSVQFSYYHDLSLCVEYSVAQTASP
jgi:hypothetical protein